MPLFKGRERREHRREEHAHAARTAVAVGGGIALGAAIANRRHHQREEHHNEAQASSSEEEDDGAPKTFCMREKLLAFGDSFTINRVTRRHQRGRPAYFANNKVLRMRETFHLQSSRNGSTLYTIQERKLRVRDSMAIEDADGQKIAEIKKKVIGIVRDNFVVKVKDDTNWHIHGSILEHNFTIKEGGEEIVKVHKNWIAPIRECYFIDIHGTDDVALALMVVIGLEAMTED
uniref:Tubby C-terminal domain-containing protein n=1 Tax=Pseudo-nitzschia australis TaxID=44445 RepID=A0A7S4EMU6_9STRA